MKFSRVSILTLSTLVILSGIIFAADYGRIIQIDLTHAVQHIGQINFRENNNNTNVRMQQDGSVGNVSIINANNFIIHQDDDTKIEDSSRSSIIGGQNNTISNSSSSTIIAGLNNAVNDSEFAVIGGGRGNTIENNKNYSTILGGRWNNINSSNSSIIGGEYNRVLGDYSVVIGSNNEVIGNNSVAIGQSITVKGNNSFLRANDAYSLDSDDTFAVISDNGMVINATGANPYSQLTIGGSLVVSSGNDSSISCGNGTGVGIVKLVNKYGESSDQKCLCTCNGQEWDYLNGDGACVSACRGEPVKPVCGTGFDIINSDGNNIFIGSCAVGEIIDASYYVKGEMAYWACQSRDGSVEICGYSLACSGNIPENAHANNTLLPKPGGENTYYYNNTSYWETCTYSCDKGYSWNDTEKKCLGICDKSNNACFIGDYAPGLRTWAMEFTYTCTEGAKQEICNGLCNEGEIWDGTKCVEHMDDPCGTKDDPCKQGTVRDMRNSADLSQYLWNCYRGSEITSCSDNRTAYTINICGFNNEGNVRYEFTGGGTATLPLTVDLSEMYVISDGSRSIFTIPAGGKYSNQRNFSSFASVEINNLEHDRILIDDDLYVINVQGCVPKNICDSSSQLPGQCLLGATPSNTESKKVGDSATFSRKCTLGANTQTCSPKTYDIKPICSSKPANSTSCDPDRDSDCTLVSSDINLNDFYVQNGKLTTSRFGNNKPHCTFAGGKITCTNVNNAGTAEGFKCNPGYTKIGCTCNPSDNICNTSNNTCNYGYTPTNFDGETWKTSYLYKCDEISCSATCPSGQYWNGFKCVAKPSMCDTNHNECLLGNNVGFNNETDKEYTRSCGIGDISENCKECKSGYTRNGSNCVPSGCVGTTINCNKNVSLNIGDNTTIGCKKDNQYCSTTVSCNSDGNISESSESCNNVCNTSTNPGSCIAGATREWKSGYNWKSAYSYTCIYQGERYDCPTMTCPSGQYRNGTTHQCVTKPSMCGSSGNECLIGNSTLDSSAGEHQYKWKCSIGDMSTSCKLCHECYEEVSGVCTLKSTPECQPTNQSCNLPSSLGGGTLTHGRSITAYTSSTLQCTSTSTKCYNNGGTLSCDNGTLYWKGNKDSSKTVYNNRPLYQNCTLTNKNNSEYTLTACPSGKSCTSYIGYTANNSTDTCTEDIKFKESGCAAGYSLYNGTCCQDCGSSKCGEIVEGYTTTSVTCTSTSDKCVTASMQCLDGSWNGSVRSACSLQNGTNTCDKTNNPTTYITSLSTSFSNATRQSNSCSEYTANNTNNRCEETKYYTYKCNDGYFWNSTHTACVNICNSNGTCNFGSKTWNDDGSYNGTQNYGFYCSYNGKTYSCEAVCGADEIWDLTNHECVDKINPCDNGNHYNCKIGLPQNGIPLTQGGWVRDCYDSNGIKLNKVGDICHECIDKYHWNNSTYVCDKNRCQSYPNNSTVCSTTAPDEDNTVTRYVSSCSNEACTFTCDTKYHYNSSSVTCDKNTCEGRIENSTACTTTAPNINGTTRTVVETCNNEPCTVKCNSTYHKTNNSCTLNVCYGTIPSNSTRWNQKSPTVNLTIFTYSETDSNTACTFHCNDGFHRNSSSKLCEPNPKCTFDGNKYNEGDTITAYVKDSVACNRTCTEGVFTCSDGKRYYNSSENTPYKNCDVTQCDAGKYCKAGTCTSCECGTYSEGGTVTSCTACGKGKYSSAGSSSCTTCTSDKYCSNDKTCTPFSCPSGYSSPAGSDDKSDCTIKCNPGYHVATVDATCSKCDAGTYQSSFNTVKAGTTSSCNSCDSGTWSNAGASNCTSICESISARCNFGSAITNGKIWKPSYLCSIPGISDTECECDNGNVWNGSECVVGPSNPCVNDSHYECNKSFSDDEQNLNNGYFWNCYDGDGNKLNRIMCYECKDGYSGSTCTEQYSCLGSKPSGTHVQLSTVSPTTNTYRHTAGGSLNTACTWRCDSGWSPNSSTNTCVENKCQGTKPENSDCSTATPSNNTTSRSLSTSNTSACTCKCKNGYALTSDGCVPSVSVSAQIVNSSSSVILRGAKAVINGQICTNDNIITNPGGSDSVTFDGCSKLPGNGYTITVIANNCGTCRLESNGLPGTISSEGWLGGREMYGLGYKRYCCEGATSSSSCENSIKIIPHYSRSTFCVDSDISLHIPLPLDDDYTLHSDDTDISSSCYQSDVVYYTDPVPCGTYNSVRLQYGVNGITTESDWKSVTVTNSSSPTVYFQISNAL